MMQSAKPLLIIGTRGSPLALWQAERVRECLSKAHGLAESDVSIEVIKTTGDMIQDRPLTEIGGKALFTKEIEQALIDRRIDIAVHSAKDMLAFLPDGLTIAAYLEREDPRDALIGQTNLTLMALPPGSIIGTASPRRHAQVLRLRPDLTIVPLRGNVETRLRKLKAGECHATLLAIAGLKRLGHTEVATEILDVDRFLPAVAQGAIAIEARQNDDRMHALLGRINHAPTRIAVDAERAFLTILEGTCKTPIAGYAQTSNGAISFRGMILRPDGRETFETTREGASGDATRLGADAAQELKSRAPSDFFAA